MPQPTGKYPNQGFLEQVPEVPADRKACGLKGKFGNKGYHPDGENLVTLSEAELPKKWDWGEYYDEDKKMTFNLLSWSKNQH